MSEARVIINIKEGIIELQGPVDFVRHYLDQYQSAIKGLRRLPATARPEEKAAVLPQEGPEAPEAGMKKSGRGACIGAIRNFIIAGFFNELRSLNDVRKHLAESEIVCTDKAVRAGLTRLARSGALSRTGRGRGLRYSRPE